MTEIYTAKIKQLGTMIARAEKGQAAPDKDTLANGPDLFAEQEDDDDDQDDDDQGGQGSAVAAAPGNQPANPNVRRPRSKAMKHKRNR